MARQYGVFALLLGVLLAPALVVAQSSPKAAPIEPAVQAAFAAAAATDTLPVIVVLRDQTNAARVVSSNQKRKDRQKAVVQALRTKAASSQKAIRQALDKHVKDGSVASYTPFWIQNAIAVRATRAVINELASRSDVAVITADQTVVGPGRTALTSSATSEQNIAQVHAPDLWALGYNGQGIVVANLDSGVDATHPDLSAQWRGGTNSWLDPFGQHSSPFDATGHGTWTMSVMVGRDTGGTAIGMAPQATWIAARIFNDSGTSTASVIHQSLQWVLDPDNNPATADGADVVNNSWALGSPGCSLDFELDLEALVAAGTTPVFAAGNFGPGSNTSPSPANNPAAFAVGATEADGTIYSGSSQGPTSCGLTEPATYPAVVAPGVNIYTADLYGGYYMTTGTSLAAPHAAGALALLLSAFPNLTVSEQRAALHSTAADLGAAGPDNTFGAGLIDVLAAYNALAAGTIPTPTSPPPPTATDTPTATATATNTPIPPTATATNTPTATATNTPVPPTATATRTPTPTTASRLFADGFESGNFSAWSSSATNSGKLSVSTGAALEGSRGMQAQISGTTAIYVQNNAPANESSYHARFRFHPHNTSTGSSQHDILIARTGSASTTMRVQYRLSSGAYQIRAGAINNGSTQYTSWYTIANASTTIEVAWQAASTSTGTNGVLTLWLNGASKQTLSSLKNGTQRIEDIRLGIPGGLVSGMSGTEYFDGFVSTRTTYIGP